MKRTWMLASLLSVLLATPAMAEFTPAEQTELKRLLTAQRHVYRALFYEASAIQGGGWNAAPQPLLIGALRATSGAMREISYALSGLLNVVTEQVQTPHYDALAALVRAERVSVAFSRVDRALRAVDVANGWLLSATGVEKDNAAYQDAVRRARTIWLANAKDELSQINRSLGYLEPDPVSHPKIVGPHGVYDEAQWNLWRSGFYTSDFLDYFVDAIEADRSLSRPLTIHKVLDTAGQILVVEGECQLRLVMPVVTQDATLDIFFRVLSVVKRLTLDTSELFHTMQATSAADVRQVLPSVLHRLTDSWRHMDRAIWEMLDFPECTPQQQARGCGGL